MGVVVAGVKGLSRRKRTQERAALFRNSPSHMSLYQNISLATAVENFALSILSLTSLPLYPP